MEYAVNNGVHDLFAALAISQLLFMGGAYFLHYRQSISGKLLILYCVGVIAFLLGRISLFSQLPVILSMPVQILRISIPVVFWLLSHCLFNDTGKPPRIIVATLALYLILRIAEVLILSTRTVVIDNLAYQLFIYLRQIFILLLVAHACLMAVQGYSADLMDDRRRLRPLFVLTMGGIILIISGSNLFSIYNEIAMALYLLAIFLATFILNIRMFQLQNDFTASFHPTVQKDLQSHLSDAERACYQKILKELNQNKLYAQPGLTLSKLAAALHMKEYRLREFINRKLHYRNFNQFINDFRLNLAIAKLKDLEDDRTLVSTIAWDLGYSSPSSFNKVFKEKFGCTPSEYRKRLYDSPASSALVASQS